MRCLAPVLICLFVCSSLLAEQRIIYPVPFAQAASDEPTISFADDEVVVAGMTENADALLMSLAVDIRHAVLSRVWYHELGPTTGGEAVFAPSFGVPRRSVWLATDLEGGTTIAASPPGFTLKEKPRPWGSVHPGGGNEPDYLLDESEALVVWLIRPKEGAWYLLAGDGAANDLDETPNGIVVLPFDRFEPVGDGPPLTPPRPLPSDLLLTIDRRTLEYYVAPVRDLMRGGGGDS